MEFFNEAVGVLKTLAKALNGDFAPDWKSCHKRSLPYRSFTIINMIFNNLVALV